MEVWQQPLSDTAELGDNASREVLWIVTGTESEIDALAAISATAPTVWNDYYFRQAIKIERIGIEEWEGRVTYGPKESDNKENSQDSDDPNDGSWKLSFETTGGTQHVSNSIQTLTTGNNIALLPDGAPDFKGAINVSDSGVGGVDIHVPVFQWSETRQLPRAVALSFDYLRVLYTLTGRVNDATFRGFDALEVLFLGAKGDVSAKDPRYVEVTYNFAASKNVEGVTVGACDPVNKYGWNYLWVYYLDTEDASHKIKQPAAVYVEHVYYSDDFSQLLIGT
jgi:hypothetical protein